MAEQRARGWWYPWIFFGGFMVVLAVNMALLFFATSTFNGLETRHPYEEGNNYNAQIAQAEKQAKLGWTVSFAASGGEMPAALAAKEGRPARLTLTVKDASGAPLEGLEVFAQIRRPTQEGHDQSVTLDPVTPGHYARTVDLPMPGQWEVRLMARRGEDSYHLRERFDIR